MTTRLFDTARLKAAVQTAGGVSAVNTRLRERFSLAPETARKRLSRAMKGVAQGLEICEVVLLACNVPRAENESYLLPLPSGVPSDLTVSGQNAASAAFGIHAEVDPLVGGREVERPGVGLVYLGGCQVLLALTNSSHRPLTVRSVLLNVAWADTPRERYARGAGTVGEGIVPHQLFVELHREGRFSGWWRFAKGQRELSEPAYFDSGSPQLLQTKDGARSLFHLVPGDTEWIQANFIPRDEGLFTVSVMALAVNAEMDKAAKRTEPFHLALGEAVDAQQ